MFDFCRVYAFDLRGFGLSDRPKDAINYSVEQHVDDLAEVIGMLKEGWVKAEFFFLLKIKNKKKLFVL